MVSLKRCCKVVLSYVSARLGNLCLIPTQKVCPISENHVLTFIWVFKNLPIASEILTQPSRYKIAERNLLADGKGPQKSDTGSCLVIHLCCRLFLIQGLKIIITLNRIIDILGTYLNVLQVHKV